MKKDLMDILARPVCKGELVLHSEAEEGDEVIVKAPKGDIEYEVEEIEYK